MTTTSTYQGMEAGAKPSSRVLAPPGGGSSNIFGGYADQDDGQKRHARSTPNNVNKGNNDIFGKGDQLTPGTSPGKKHNRDNVNCGNNDIFNQDSHPDAGQPKSRAPRSEFNPITGQPYEQSKPPQAEEEKKPEEADVAAATESSQPAQRQQRGGASSGIFGEPEPANRVQASTRVSQPPGGRSTKLW